MAAKLVFQGAWSRSVVLTLKLFDHRHQSHKEVVTAMLAWLALCSLVDAAGAVTAGSSTACNVSIGFDTYREEVLARNIAQPSGLAVDFTHNILFFSYFNGTHLSATLDLGTKEVSEIEELNERCLFAVDQTHAKVHAGCGHYRQGNGLYQFDSNFGRFAQTGEPGQLINFVHYNEVLYYSYYPMQLLRIFRRGQSIPVEDVTSEVFSLVIDKYKDRIFYNSTGLYRQRADDLEESLYADIDKPHALAVDTRGSVFACNWGNKAGIYRLHDRAAQVTKLLDIDWCSSLTFDHHNNLIYPDDNRIMRLVKC